VTLLDHPPRGATGGVKEPDGEQAEHRLPDAETRRQGERASAVTRCVVTVGEQRTVGASDHEHGTDQ
jgi:hypothetical protein